MNKKLIKYLFIAFIVSLLLPLLWAVVFSESETAFFVEKSQFEGKSQQEISELIKSNSEKVSFKAHVVAVASSVVSDVPGYLKASFAVYLILFICIYFLVKIRGEL